MPAIALPKFNASAEESGVAASAITMKMAKMMRLSFKEPCLPVPISAAYVHNVKTRLRESVDELLHAGTSSLKIAEKTHSVAVRRQQAYVGAAARVHLPMMRAIRM